LAITLDAIETLDAKTASDDLRVACLFPPDTASLTKQSRGLAALTAAGARPHDCADMRNLAHSEFPLWLLQQFLLLGRLAGPVWARA
jgi:hypothetical protein